MEIMWVVLQVILAYFVVDAIAGLYHLMTDLGYNIPSQVGFFRKHHDEPWTMTFDLQPMVAGVPFFLIGLYFMNAFLISAGIFFCVAQIPHYYIHHDEKTPRIVRWLQKSKLIVSPESHNEHHFGNGKFDKNFCIFTGHSDFWINRLAKFLIKE